MPNEIFISWDLFEYHFEYIQRSLHDLNSLLYRITELLIEIYVCLVTIANNSSDGVQEKTNIARVILYYTTCIYK